MDFKVKSQIRHAHQPNVYLLSFERLWKSYLNVAVESSRDILSYEMNGKSWGETSLK